MSPPRFARSRASTRSAPGWRTLPWSAQGKRRAAPTAAVASAAYSRVTPGADDSARSSSACRYHLTNPDVSAPPGRTTQLRGSGEPSTAAPDLVILLRRRGGGCRCLPAHVRRENVDQQQHRRFVAVVADLGGLEWP